ncbi:MAG: glycosyltransferase, partial [Chloroflexota bacterium]
RLATRARRITLLPHALDERLLAPRFPDPPGRLAARPLIDRPLVIGSMGTLTHDEDLELLLPALFEIARLYPGRVSLELTGMLGKAVTRQKLAGLPVRFIGPQGEEQDYPLFMLWFTSRVQWDIALAPLADTSFNQAKSEIKFLDYSAIAAAGIYSPIPAYRAAVQPGVTGLLAESTPAAWLEALRRLIEAPDLREQIARRAWQELHAGRTLAHCYPHWIEAFDLP